MSVTKMDFPWAQLLNSDWHDYLGRGRDEDRLESPRWLKAFLAPWDVPLALTWSPGTRRALRELRALLRRLVSRLRAGEPVDDEDMAVLNSYLSAGPLVHQLVREGEEYRLKSRPVKVTLEVVLAEIARSFATMLAEGDPRRLKICENPDCRWVFYDLSKNRMRRWCEGATGCGNLIKVRRFRERRRRDGYAGAARRREARSNDISNRKAE